MVKRNISCSLIIGLIILIIMLVFPIRAVAQTHSLASELIFISDFDDFVICNDDPYFTSNISSQEISIQYHGNGTEHMINETIYMDVSKYGIVSDFGFDIKIDYSYNGEQYGRGEAILGGYNWEDGRYDGTPFENKGKPICKCSFSDPWSAYPGRYNIVLYIDDNPDNVETEQILLNSGDADFSMHRNQKLVECQVTDQGLISLDHAWSQDLNKPLSYVALRLEVYPEWTNISYVAFSELVLELFVYDYTPTTIDFTPTTIVLPVNISSILVFISYISYRKKKIANKIIR